jgi:hypothetical protein
MTGTCPGQATESAQHVPDPAVAGHGRELVAEFEQDITEYARI